MEVARLQAEHDAAVGVVVVGGGGEGFGARADVEGGEVGGVAGDGVEDGAGGDGGEGGGGGGGGGGGVVVGNWSASESGRKHGFWCVTLGGEGLW